MTALLEEAVTNEIIINGEISGSLEVDLANWLIANGRRRRKPISLHYRDECDYKTGAWSCWSVWGTEEESARYKIKRLEQAEVTPLRYLAAAGQFIEDDWKKRRISWKD